MPSPFESPAIRYGISLLNALVIAVVAFVLLDGTTRWVALGVAVLEIAVTPQILKQVDQ